jgi:HPt (histidine-containing phosphotransfer) domain-containing protein
MSTGYQHIDLSYLELIADGDEEMKVTMLEMLFNEPKNEIEKMIQLEKEKKWDELFKASHKMKSTLSFVGNIELSDLNKSVEKAALGETDKNDLATILLKIQEKFSMSLIELKKEYNNLIK